MNIKILLLIILFFSVLAFILLPKTFLAQRLKMTVGLFYSLNIIVIIFGLVGMAATIGWQDQLLEKHYFELILLPIFFALVYPAIVESVHRAVGVYDEKQQLNLTQAAALTWPISIIAVLFMFTLYKEGILTGYTFFPLYLFFSVTVYAALSIYFFKTN